MTVVRQRARAALARRFEARPEGFDADGLSAPAVVFAPHADDETLGCGGTIARKIEAGATVTIVVVSDGAAAQVSTPREELAALRRNEAVAAAEALGVPADRVRFLEFEDGKLANAGGALVDAVCSILDRERPRQVFVPWRGDGHPDHEATFRAVIRAARSVPLECDVLQYPVWAWRHWPWVGLRAPRGDELPPWRASAKFLGGWRFPRTFPVTSHIGEALPRKRAALACYASQTDPAGEWSLATVSAGEFLATFDEPFEVFRRGRLQA